MAHAVGRLLPALVLCCSVAAQTRVTLEQAAERRPPEYVPALAGQTVTLSGVVAASPIRVRAYTHAVIQDASGHGFTLEGAPELMVVLRAGDNVDATGEIAHRAGLPVLRVQNLAKTGSSPPPVPQRMSVAELMQFGNLGRLVTVETRVFASGQNAGGDILVLGDSERSITVFLPRANHKGDGISQKFRPGTIVRATGLSSQYCPVEPFDRNFQLLIADATGVTMVAPGWFVSPDVMLYVIVGMIFAAVVWWRRERTLQRQRRVLTAVMKLSEGVLSASSPKDIVRRLQADLPRAVDIQEVELYLHDRPNNELDRVTTDLAPQPLGINVDAPIGSFHATVALCFRNRSLLHVPDTRHSPLVSGRENHLPRSAVFVPMLAQADVLGIMAAYYRKPVRRPSPDLHAALQHLANQIAAALKLQEQQHMREQLMRSEKMAAAGQLISGIANDLRTPLESIAKSARRMLQRPGEVHPDLREVATDAERGLDMINHLLSFARMERGEARPLDVYGIVNNLLEIREHERELKGIRADISLPLAPVQVLADRAQIEQALLTVLVHAEHAAAASGDKLMRVTSRVLGKRVQVFFDFSHTVTEDPFENLNVGDYFGLPVAQAIAQSHGGDIRFVSTRSGCRLEFELAVHDPPSQQPAVPTPQKPARMLTALIVEPDVVTQRKLLSMLALRGHRAVPAPSAEEAADLVQRMQFDVVFCGARLMGPNWVEFFQRVRRRVGTFALLTEGYDAESARAFKGGEGHVLPKPLDDRELEQFLGIVEVRLAASRR